MRKRTVTTIEIAELVVVSRARTENPRPPCPICAGRVMVTPEEAAVLTRVMVRSIYSRIEAEGVHFLEMPSGLLLLCADSLSQRARFDAVRLNGAENQSSANRLIEQGEPHEELDA